MIEINYKLYYRVYYNYWSFLKYLSIVYSFILNYRTFDVDRLISVFRIIACLNLYINKMHINFIFAFQ